KYLVERDSPDNSAVSVNSKPSKPSGLRGLHRVYSYYFI
uniref:Discs, largehomolog 2 n=1 Tax=Ascaris lumbricoides TaxID=6252 RepID=A0A0M3IWI7_ASCLU